MVFHGCVDGYSRTIIYLDCLNNNRASSVLSLFQGGVRNFGLPSRVQCDRGMENIEVARFKLCRRGLNRRSIIAERSVHNQRIERLSELHLFVLHYVYLPRIQRAVREFTNQWNNHALSTERHMTPLQLWHRGVICRVGQNNMAVNSVFDTNDSSINVDTGPLAEDVLSNQVSIPETNFHVNNTTLNEIHQTFDPLQDDGNHRIDIFLALLNFLETRQ